MCTSIAVNKRKQRNLRVLPRGVIRDIQVPYLSSLNKYEVGGVGFEKIFISKL
jgi:hypothetical protein